MNGVFSLKSYLLFLSVMLATPVFYLSSQNGAFKELYDIYTATSSQAQVEVDDDSPLKSPEASFGNMTLSEQELVSRALLMLAKEDPSSEPDEKIMGSEVWKSLSFFTENEKRSNNTLVGSISKTHSLVGELMLAKKLTQPTTNIILLKKRQAFIQRLITDEKLFNKIDTLIARYARAEKALLAISQAESALYDEGLAYFHHKVLYPKSTSALYEYPLLQDGLKGFLDVFLAGGLITYPAAVLSVLGHVYYYDIAPLLFSDNAIKQRPSLIEKISGTKVPYAGALSLLFTAPFLWFCTKHIKGIIHLMKNRILSLEYMKKHMRPIKKVSQSVKESLDLMYEIKELQALNEDFLPNPQVASDRKKRLDAALKSSAFKKRNQYNYFFTRNGKVISALTLLKNSLSELGKNIHLVGMLDAYLSCARLLKEQTADHPYCFAMYHEASAPYLHCTTLWHPILGPERCVTNTITLGDNHKDILLTGPNGSGKSTFLKALAICVVLGQTFGIAPAAKCSFTPFSAIHAYANVTDDLEANRSLFRAELLRCLDLINSVEALPENKFAFCILDQIFMGTEPIEGQAAAYSVTRHLSTCPNALVCSATNFSSLTVLQDETKGICRNKSFHGLTTPDGGLAYPYKIYDKHNIQMTALTTLQEEAFPSSLCSEIAACLSTTRTHS